MGHCCAGYDLYKHGASLSSLDGTAVQNQEMILTEITGGRVPLQDFVMKLTIYWFL
jgi:hypothetical protein